MLWPRCRRRNDPIPESGLSSGFLITTLSPPFLMGSCSQETEPCSEPPSGGQSQDPGGGREGGGSNCQEGVAGEGRREPNPSHGRSEHPLPHRGMQPASMRRDDVCKPFEDPKTDEVRAPVLGLGAVSTLGSEVVNSVPISNEVILLKVGNLAARVRAPTMSCMQPSPPGLGVQGIWDSEQVASGIVYWVVPCHADCFRSSPPS